MATSSNIYIHLRPEDRNKTFKTPWGFEIKPEGKQYLYIYCHNDGCPSGVGSDLCDENFTYNEAINFICKGDRSTVQLSYYAWRNEHCEPYVADEIEYNTNYVYMLDYTDDSDKVVVKIVDPNKDYDECYRISEENIIPLEDYYG